MATTLSVSTLLSSLCDSLNSSFSSLPSPSAIRPPPSAFSLLSTKNDIFLAYLQNLALLIILNLRAHPANQEAFASFPHSSAEVATGESNVDHHNSSGISARTTKPDGHKPHIEDENRASNLCDEVLGNLIGLRVYLEKGVRPLEGHLRYQLDKLLLAAAEQARERIHHNARLRNKTKDSHADDPERSSSGTATPPIDDDDENEASIPAFSIPPLAHRPNPSALKQPSSTLHAQTVSTASMKTIAPYRPPRVNPTAPPTGTASKRAPRRSRAMDVFVREEMGDAPVAEMSIGAGRGGVAEGGRLAEREREKNEWEETKMARLPGEKKRKRDAGDDVMAGMDWSLIDDERGGREERERKGKKRKSKKNGGRGDAGKRKARR